MSSLILNLCILFLMYNIACTYDVHFGYLSE